MLEVFKKTGKKELINTNSLDYENRGVIVYFWSLSQAGCMSRLPLLSKISLNSGEGLSVIGVHTPEYEFEKDPAVVADASSRLGLEFPVVNDPDYYIWTYFNNLDWDSIYFFDPSGVLIGEYSGQEWPDDIANLIHEISGKRIRTVAASPEGAEKFREIPLGTARGRIGNLPPSQDGTECVLELPDDPAADTAYLEGKWIIYGEYSMSCSGESSLFLKFSGNEFGIVLAPGTDRHVEFNLDGNPGKIEVDYPGLHNLNIEGGHGKHSLKLKLPEGMNCYSLMFR